MRRSLGPLLLPVILAAGLVTGCGAQTASDSGASSGRTPASASTGPVDFTRIAMISQTAAGGRVDPSATVLDSRAAVASFADRFRGGLLQGRLQQAIDGAHLGAGQVPVAAVVAVGCDAPSGVEVQRTEEGLRVVGQQVKSSTPECLAPVTTVAVVAVPSGLA